MPDGLFPPWKESAPADAQCQAPAGLDGLGPARDDREAVSL